MAIRSWPVGGAGYLRGFVSGECVRSTSRKELGDSGRRDRAAEAEDWRSSVGDADAVDDGDGDASLTGRRWKDMLRDSRKSEKETYTALYKPVDPGFEP